MKYCWITAKSWGMTQVSEGNVIDGVQRILGFYLGLFINKINVNGTSIVLYGVCFTTTLSNFMNSFIN